MKFLSPAAFGAAAILVAALSPAHAQPAKATTGPGETVWIGAPQGRLKARAYASPHRSAHPRLVVVLHGDAPRERPDYQYAFARRAAAALDDAVVVAILRPGYTDPDGDTSAGRRGATTGDNYTPEVVESLASGVAELKARYGARDITLVGHSGGAALSALLVERHPELARRALLVSCPCDVSAWRLHMARAQLNPAWLAPVHSLSPIAGTTHLSNASEFLMIVGADDNVAPARFSESFARTARRTGAQVRVQVAPGLGHEILLAPVVMTALTAFEGA